MKKHSYNLHNIVGKKNSLFAIDKLNVPWDVKLPHLSIWPKTKVGQFHRWVGSVCKGEGHSSKLGCICTEFFTVECFLFDMVSTI